MRKTCAVLALVCFALVASAVARAGIDVQGDILYGNSWSQRWHLSNVGDVGAQFDSYTITALTGYTLETVLTDLKPTDWGARWDVEGSASTAYKPDAGHTVASAYFTTTFVEDVHDGQVFTYAVKNGDDVKESGLVWYFDSPTDLKDPQWAGYTFKSIGNSNFYVSDLAPVPEASTLVGFGTLLAMSLLAFRRKKA